MPKELLTRCCFEATDIESRATEDGKGEIITGYAARFESLSVPLYGFREKIRSGAFKSSLEQNSIVALWNHNTDMVLGSTRGKTLKLWEDDKGLRFELQLPDTQAGRDAGISIKRKDVTGVSFGFRVRKQEWDETDPKNVVRTLIDIDLREVSPTAFPAYPSTSVSVRSIADDYDEYKKEKDKTETVTNENKLQTMLRYVEAL